MQRTWASFIGENEWHATGDTSNTQIYINSKSKDKGIDVFHNLVDMVMPIFLTHSSFQNLQYKNEKEIK